MKSLIEEAYRCRGARYIHVDKYAQWSNDVSCCGNTVCLTLEQLLDHFNFLIDNIFIRVGPSVFQQTVGIPMGTDCAPLIADLFLFSFEFEFMKTLIRANLPKARTFNNTFRYIDDLLTLNNPQFTHNISHIYPKELELKKTTEGIDTCSYLDLSITIANHKFRTDLYDKRDSFNFEIVSFPHMDSNIPSKPAYGVFVSQLVRYLRVCDSYYHFKERSSGLTRKLQQQGYRFDRLQTTFKKFLQRNPMALRKYKMDHKHMLIDCVCLPPLALPSVTRYVSTR